MSVHGIWWESLGDGTAQVHARTEAGSDIDVVLPLNLLDTGLMHQVLQRRGDQVDAQNAAIQARAGRTEHD